MDIVYLERTPMFVQVAERRSAPPRNQRFAKWRGVIALSEVLPTRGCTEANAHALARCAALCQEAGLVPVVEPAVLMEGEDPLEPCREVTEEVLRTVFNQLYAQRVRWRAQHGVPGIDLPQSANGRRGGRRNGGMSPARRPRGRSGNRVLVGATGELDSTRLDAMNLRFQTRLSGALAFSFARAIQPPALEIWKGRDAHVFAARQALNHRARCNRAARRGEYTAATERMGA